MRQVAIIGAGITGRLLAFRLSSMDWKVHLFERVSESAKDTCSFAASGMLSPYCELEAAENSIFRLGLRSLSLWADILGELPTPVFFQREGSLVVAHPYDQPELVRLSSRLTEAGVAGRAMQFLDRDGLRALEPDLEDRFSTGIYFPEEGQIDNRAVLGVLLESIRENGVVCSFEEPVVEVRPHEVQLPDECLTFDNVVDCRGIAGKKGLPELRGVRGELIHLHAPEVHIKRPVRLMHPKYPLYVVPRPNHRYLVGATSLESDSGHPLTVRSALELLSAAFALHPSFAEAVIVESIAQVRPAFPDNLPRVYHEEGLTKVNGMYRHGYLISPAVVQLVTQFLDQGTISFEDSFLFKEAS
jgi:glycine oxidase